MKIINQKLFGTLSQQFNQLCDKFDDFKCFVMKENREFQTKTMKHITNELEKLSEKGITVDLNDYYTKEEIDSKVNDLNDDISNVGKPTDEQVSNAIYEYIDEYGIEAGGLTPTEKNLILTLFKNAQYTSDISTEYAQLEALLLSRVTTYTINNTLSHVTTNNNATSGEEQSSYTATLTANEGYDLTIGTVIVLMGGSDVTSSVYDSETGIITITSLTGNVVITATALENTVSEALYELSTPFVGDGASSIDTGVKLNLTDDDWAIAVDFSFDGSSQNGGCVFSTHGQNYAQALNCKLGYYVTASVSGGGVNGAIYNEIANGFKYVYVHKAGETTATVYYMKDGVLTNETPTTAQYWANANSTPTNLMIGQDASPQSSTDARYLKTGGVVNQLKIYGRVITTDELNTFMEV